MKKVSYKTSKAAITLIEKIIVRAESNASLTGEPFDRIAAKMDITACHCNGCPLKLEELLHAPVSTFDHDVSGISKYIEKTTGELTKYFRPRFAA